MSNTTPNIYLPRVDYSSTLELFGITVRVYTLDDGRRVVHQDDTTKLLEAMNERHIRFPVGQNLSD